MVKKLKKMSNRGKEENEGLTPKQKEFVEFLEFDEKWIRKANEYLKTNN